MVILILVTLQYNFILRCKTALATFYRFLLLTVHHRLMPLQVLFAMIYFITNLAVIDSPHRGPVTPTNHAVLVHVVLSLDALTTLRTDKAGVLACVNVTNMPLEVVRTGKCLGCLLYTSPSPRD